MIDIELLAEKVHQAYCQYQIDVKGKEYWTKGDYSQLDEETKEADRYTVRAVLKALNDEELVTPRVLLDSIRYVYHREYKGYTIRMKGAGQVYFTKDERDRDLFIAELKVRILTMMQGNSGE